jgi:PAS domain S-box-containing protein
MGERTRAFDWGKTPVGPAACWPQSLKTVVRIMLDSRYAMWLGWGPEFIFFYNDAYARMTLGPKHPWALGRPAREVWSEIWDDIGPRAESVLRTGQATWDEGLQLFLERRGFAEETYHTFSYSPVPDDGGGVGGLLCVVIEDTERTIGERRLRTLQALAARTTDEAKSVEEACQAAADVLAGNPSDLPFVLLYLSDADGRLALAGRTGVGEEAGAGPWPFHRAAETGKALVVDELPGPAGRWPGGAWPEPAHQAVVLPLARPGQARPAGFVVAGVSPRRPLDEGYRGFLGLLAGQLASAVANARAYDEERRRAEKLAELDRAKTAFFSNVSHEFRTPLTLLLAPVEDALARQGEPGPDEQRALLEVVHRNGLRLQRLVNSLLDFARLEAGRLRAVYQPTDLAAFTADLASVFRAAVERAGLRLVVDCPPLPAPVFVDRQMWEKVVFNLLSNAFKFTFQGEVAVTVRPTLPGPGCGEGGVRLQVRDTGAGIPAEEMPRIFERFHRVENARGRTHEGSGIGLALVQELVKLHGGTVAAESVLGQGSCFTVTLPLGSAHLPAEHVVGGDGPLWEVKGANPYVEEALRWLPGKDEGGRMTDGPPADSSFLLPPSSFPARVLLADDNADMRQYMSRLLGEHFAVEAVGDGEAALAAARERPPDLVLTDVMMPRMDGFALLRALRADPRTRELPVLMLSARAGEESRVEGMQAGVDDYMVKPFGGRELLARVSALLQMARLRREAGEAVRQGEERLRMALTAARMVAWQLHPATGALVQSDNAGDVFGLPPGARLENAGQRFALVHPDDRERHRALVEQAAAEQGSYASQFRVVRPDTGAVIWLEERGHAVRVGDAEVRLVGVAMDVTDRKKAEEALKEADRRKDEFLATLAHELRNPLAPLRNGLQVMKLTGDQGGAVEQARRMMERQLGQMVRLIDDLLDVSRISRGKLDLRTERAELAQVVQHAVETSRPLVEACGHTLRVHLPAEPVYVDGDVTRLAQVFANLLNNAAKYTDPGGRLWLTVGREGPDAVVRVRDTGVGIPADMLTRVFEMFTQVDRSLERAQGGLGIGLSLVKGLVEKHGGSVAAHSDGPGRGSEFVVRLPAAVRAPAEGRAAPPHPGDGAGGRRILVVDDNRDAAASLATLLGVMGNQTRTGHDGLQALEVGEAFRPEVIFLDIGMPRLNGYEAARRIRQSAWGAGVVLVALTGWGQEDDRRRSHEAGFNFHLVKPVEPAALEALLAGLPAQTA